jgi:hypothetical protein
MLKVTRLAESLKEIFGTEAEKAAVASGWQKRPPKKLDGPSFAQTLVNGWLGQPQASLGQLSQSAASVGAPVSAQGLDQRFNAESAEMMCQLLAKAVSQVLLAEPAAVELLGRFSAVEIGDSSTVVLPGPLETLWPGCGGLGQSARAAVKLYVRWDLKSGGMQGPFLTEGRRADTRSPLLELELSAGALKVEDLGFFSTEHFASLSERGIYWLSRLKLQTALYTPEGQEIELFDYLPVRRAEVLDMFVLLGAKHRLACRLIALRVPLAIAEQRRRRLRAEAVVRRKPVSARSLALCDWTVLVTNAPRELLCAEEAMVLLRARWQIERLFRLWKQYGLIDESRSQKPWRVLTELYAKLLAVLIQHWCTLTALWDVPARSLVKAAQTIRSHASLLAAAFRGVLALSDALEQIRSTLRAGCRLNSRRSSPNTYQLLLQPDLLGYF